MIRFEEITNKNIWKVCLLEPFEEQKDFVAENRRILAQETSTGSTVSWRMVRCAATKS